jgi:hypothetical protein
MFNIEREIHALRIRANNLEYMAKNRADLQSTVFADDKFRGLGEFCGLFDLRNCTIPMGVDTKLSDGESCLLFEAEVVIQIEPPGCMFPVFKFCCRAEVLPTMWPLQPHEFLLPKKVKQHLEESSYRLFRQHREKLFKMWQTEYDRHLQLVKENRKDRNRLIAKIKGVI